MKEWRPNPGVQELALQSNVYELLYGGSAGGGKSEFLLVDVLYQINNPKYRAILFRKSFPELERSLILRSREMYPALGAKYNEQKKRWTFPSGAQIEFGYLDNDRAVYMYQSAEYAYIGFDEATHFTAFQVEYMKSRNRCPDKTVKKFIRYGSNPGNLGHVYFKKRFIDGKIPFEVYIDQKTGLTYQFIPAKVYDNKILMDNDPDYVKRLEGLPDKEKKMLLHGSWDVFEGQYFDCWNPEIHIIPPFQIPESWEKFIALDYGQKQPSAVGFFAIDYDGKLYMYKEIWGTGYTYKTLAEKIRDNVRAEDNISYLVTDPAIYSMHGEDKTGAQILDEVLDSVGIVSIPGNNDRITGWTYFRQHLSPYEKKNPITGEVFKTANLVFFNTCVNAIRTIPQLIYSGKSSKMEDLDTNQKDENGLNLDDCADMVRYGIMSRYSKPQQKKDRFEEMLQEIKRKEGNNWV